MQTQPRVRRFFTSVTGQKRYDCIREVAKILAALSSLNEKISEDGTLTLEIVRLHEKLLRLKEELTKSRDELPILLENGKTGEYESLRKIHNKNVERLKKMLDSYNRLIADYQELADLAKFIQHNRLDRPAVSLKLCSTYNSCQNRDI